MYRVTIEQQLFDLVFFTRRVVAQIEKTVEKKDSPPRFGETFRSLDVKASVYSDERV